MILRYFNSIKVRLNHPELNVGGSANIFQFHKGTIKPSFKQIKISHFVHFNSIKVRLNLCLTSPKL